MTREKRIPLPDLQSEAARPVWGGIWDDLHASPPKGCSDLTYAGRVPLGMFDQQDLYPHLITEVQGCKVAVPLGDCGEAFEQEYEVMPFHYQPLPQKEIHWGWWFSIQNVKLSGELAPHDWDDDGRIRTMAGGRLELCCVSPRGLQEWLPIPGCRTRRPAGRIYARWEIVVEHHGPHSIVRFDGLNFLHWPNG